jgi:hypothetical protein
LTARLAADAGVRFLTGCVCVRKQHQDTTPVIATVS